MSDTTLQLLAGGCHHCTPTWTKAADQVDQCFKVYIPVRGRATLSLAAQTCRLQPGHIYFIPGYHLQSQACDRRMDVHWIHFIPRSLDLFFLLSHVTQAHAWPAARYAHWAATWHQFAPFFANRPLPLSYRIHAFLLDLIAAVLEHYDLSHMAAIDPVRQRLGPAIAYMDQHYLENPRLAHIATAAGLAPNYFHRRFTQTFKVTPYAYMRERRMNMARGLLLGTASSVQAIAARTGYDNPFHFSRAFRSHFGLSPVQMRRRVNV